MADKSLRFDDDALQGWLAHADIVGVEELPAGITEPQRVTLRRDGIEMRAVLKKLSTDFGATQPTRSLNEGDRFEFDLEVDRRGKYSAVNLVPVQG